MKESDSTPFSRISKFARTLGWNNHFEYQDLQSAQISFIALQMRILTVVGLNKI